MVGGVDTSTLSVIGPCLAAPEGMDVSDRLQFLRRSTGSTGSTGSTSKALPVEPVELNGAAQGPGADEALFFFVTIC